MIGLLDIVFVVSLTWLLLHLTFYSPKAQIKRLWKEIFKNSIEISKWKKVEVVNVVHALEVRNQKIGNVINALLEYHYSGTEDDEELEYISENKY